MARDQYGHLLAAPKEPSIAVQQIAITGSSTASSAFNDRTRFILIDPEAAAHYAIGKSPTASASTSRLVADRAIFVGVTPGDKIAIF